MNVGLRQASLATRCRTLAYVADTLLKVRLRSPALPSRSMRQLHADLRWTNVRLRSPPPAFHQRLLTEINLGERLIT